METAVPMANAITTGPILVPLGSAAGASEAGAGMLVMGLLCSKIFVTVYCGCIETFAVNHDLRILGVELRRCRGVRAGGLDSYLRPILKHDPSDGRLGATRPVEACRLACLIDLEFLGFVLDLHSAFEVVAVKLGLQRLSALALQ